jgi:hypothetical protein
MTSAPYDRLIHLRRALFWGRRTPIMIVEAKPYTMHADDSGKRQSSMIVVGGYVAEAAQWELLQKEWMPKVKRHGLTEFKRSAYNMKKLGHDFPLALADIIHDRAACAFAVGIDCDDYRKVAKKYALGLYYLTPFSLCARTCVAIVRDWCRAKRVPHDHMAYIYDKGSEDSGTFFDLLRNDLSPEVKDITIIPECSHRIAGLQCADFLSWEIRNQFLKNLNPRSKDELTPELASLLRGRFLSPTRQATMLQFGVYRERDIEEVCQDAKIPLLSRIPFKFWNRPKPIRLKLPTTLRA